MTPDAPSPDLEDPQLVARARDGEERAFDLLVGRYHAVVFRVALGIVKDGDEAADVAQNAFIKAFRGLDRFRAEGTFRSWLLAIAANEARAVLRKRGRRSEQRLDEAPPLEVGGLDAAERTALRDEAARAREMMARLPEKQRLAVQLRIDEGLSYREVGEIIDSSEGAARVNYHHGIRKLREWLSQ